MGTKDLIAELEKARERFDWSLLPAEGPPGDRRKNPRLRVRGRLRQNSDTVLFDPIGAVCFFRTGIMFSDHYWVEAAITLGLSIEDARAFVRSGLAGRCRRVLIEPLDAHPDAAVQHAARMEEIVVSAGITLEQVHHGYGIACWAVNRRGLDRGHGIRIGLEDITLLPDGQQARDNADLVAAAARLIREHVRPSLL